MVFPALVTTIEPDRDLLPRFHLRTILGILACHHRTISLHVISTIMTRPVHSSSLVDPNQGLI